jgi:hypothetical protein
VPRNVVIDVRLVEAVQQLVQRVGHFASNLTENLPGAVALR